MQHLLCTVLCTKYSLGKISSLPHRHPTRWIILSRGFLAPHLVPRPLPQWGQPQEGAASPLPLTLTQTLWAGLLHPGFLGASP